MPTLSRMGVESRMAPLRRSLDALLFQRMALEGEINAVRAQMAAVQGMCGHPDRFETSTMGDRGWRCPDCGAGA